MIFGALKSRDVLLLLPDRLYKRLGCDPDRDLSSDVQQLNFVYGWRICPGRSVDKNIVKYELASPVAKMASLTFRLA